MLGGGRGGLDLLGTYFYLTHLLFSVIEFQTPEASNISGTFFLATSTYTSSWELYTTMFACVSSLFLNNVPLTVGTHSDLRS